MERSFTQRELDTRNERKSKAGCLAPWKGYRRMQVFAYFRGATKQQLTLREPFGAPVTDYKIEQLSCNSDAMKNIKGNYPTPICPLEWRKSNGADEHRKKSNDYSSNH